MTRKTKTTRKTKRTKPKGELRPSTKVRKANGQKGRIEMPISYCRDGSVHNYIVRTERGGDVWMASGLRVGW